MSYLFNVANFVVKMMSGVGMLSTTDTATTTDPWAETPEWMQNVLKPVTQVLQLLLTPLLIIIGTAGSIYAIVLGVNYSRAETADKRDEAKKRMINAIIGLVIMMLLLILMQLFVSNAAEISTWLTGGYNENIPAN